MNEIFNTNANLSPMNVGYKLTSSEIEAYMNEYLDKKDIKGVEAVTIITEREGSGANIVVNAYAFFSPNSSDITVNRVAVPDYLKSKIGVGNYIPSENLKKALGVLVPWKDGQPQIKLQLHKDHKRDLVYIKLNIFKCLALMLNAKSNYNVSILEATTIGKSKCILKVVKSVKTGKNKNDGGDALHSIASRLK